MLAVKWQHLFMLKYI